MKNIGKMIAAIRTDRHMTQQELADRIQCTKQTISNYERGTRTPDYETLEAIADALNTTMSMFVEKDEQDRELERIFRENMGITTWASLGRQNRPSATSTVDSVDNESTDVYNAESDDEKIALVFPRLSVEHKKIVLATAEALLAGQERGADFHDSTDDK